MYGTIDLMNFSRSLRTFGSAFSLIVKLQLVCSEVKQKIPESKLLFCMNKFKSSVISVKPSPLVIKFNFDIRHQFTHDCAKVTSDYINAHNTFFQNAPSKQFPPSAIGRDLTREISSVKSLLDLIEQAIDFIKLHGIILTKKVAEEDSKSAASNGVGVQVPFRAP